MSRHVFPFAVLLLLAVWMCGSSEAAHAEEGESGKVQLPQGVDVLVSGKTQVVPKGGTGESGVRIEFTSPSLVRAGGVLAVLAKGEINCVSPDCPENTAGYYDIVAGYIDPAWSLSSLVAEVDKNEWKAHTVFNTMNDLNRVGSAVKPTTIAKGNQVFLLVGTYGETYDTTEKEWITSNSDIKLVVGEATQSYNGKQSEPIKWGQPTSLLSQLTTHSQVTGLNDFVGGGGSGVLMESGTLVFPLEAWKEDGDIVSMIMYSTDDGKNWVPSKGMLPVGCRDPRITEWEGGQLLMVSTCADGQNVYESRDMGRTWTKAVRTLSGVWVNSGSDGAWVQGLDVEALVTATIGGRKVMLYTQRRYLPGETEAKALYLWVTDNNRTFNAGPLSVNNVKNIVFSSTLLYSHGELHLLQEKMTETSIGLFFAPLTEELKTIKSVLSSWAQLDASFSELSIPTSGLVGLLSDEATDDTWIDGYRCVNAMVTSATKVKSGFQFTGPQSRAIWPVNSRENNEHYGFLKYDFTLVASVTIHQVSRESTSLLGARLENDASTKIVGLSCTHDKKWEVVFNGIKTTQSSTWELGKEYQVALMLQGSSKGSVYVDGQLVGSSAMAENSQAGGFEISDFYFGGDAGDSASGGIVTVKNVFLYNRLLDVKELKVSMKDIAERLKEQNNKRDGSVRVGASRVLLLLLGLWGFAAL